MNRCHSHNHPITTDDCGSVLACTQALERLRVALDERALEPAAGLVALTTTHNVHYPHRAPSLDRRTAESICAPCAFRQVALFDARDFPAFSFLKNYAFWCRLGTIADQNFPQVSAANPVGGPGGCLV